MTSWEELGRQLQDSDDQRNQQVAAALANTDEANRAVAHFVVRARTLSPLGEAKSWHHCDDLYRGRHCLDIKPDGSWSFCQPGEEGGLYAEGPTNNVPFPRSHLLSQVRGLELGISKIQQEATRLADEWRARAGVGMTASERKRVSWWYRQDFDRACSRRDELALLVRERESARDDLYQQLQLLPNGGIDNATFGNFRLVFVRMCAAYGVDLPSG